MRPPRDRRGKKNNAKKETVNEAFEVLRGGELGFDNARLGGRDHDQETSAVCSPYLDDLDCDKNCGCEKPAMEPDHCDKKEVEPMFQLCPEEFDRLINQTGTHEATQQQVSRQKLNEMADRGCELLERGRLALFEDQGSHAQEELNMAGDGKWMRYDALVDSGSSDNVTSRKTASMVPIYPSAGSKRGQKHPAGQGRGR